MNPGKRPFTFAGLCLVLALAAASASARQFWEKTPFERWSKQDALRLLTDSPWALTDVLTAADLMAEDLSIRFKLDEDPFSKGSYWRVINTTSVRLRSALPVRQAFVRQKQIAVKYEKLADADRASFDAEVKEFLECAPCAKYYVVSVESALLNEVRGKAPGTYSPDLFQGRAYIANDRGQWRPCVHARQENQEILFFFRREGDDGKPLITSDDKTLLFTMTGTVDGGKLSPGGRWEFKVSRLTHKGEIIF
jgi:hypothetical protein